MSAISSNLTAPPDNFSTTLSSGISSSDLTIPLNSVAGLATEGVGVLFTKDANGDVVAGSVEIIHWTGIGGSSLTLTNTGDRGLTGSDSGAQAFSSGAYFEVWVTSYYYKSLRDGIVGLDAATSTLIHAATAKNPPVDADELSLLDSAASYALKKLTIAALKLAVYVGIKPAEGTMWNGKISVTDAAGITVALKTLAGTDPSASDPVYITIGGAVRTITSALSVSKADGTNWFNSGGSELATLEVDYFVYLGYNATDGVVIGFSRLPFAKQYSDFSATSTSERYCAISTITTAASTDYYNVIGRFAATLSAGAGYTWSVPTYTAINLIQRPIYESRLLTFAPVWTGYSASPTGTFKYKVDMERVILEMEVTGGGTANANTNKHTVPFAAVGYTEHRQMIGMGFNSGANTGPHRLNLDSTNTFNYSLDKDGNVWATSGTKNVSPPSGFSYNIG